MILMMIESSSYLKEFFNKKKQDAKMSKNYLTMKMEM